jgi:uncharacterized protein YdaU (DUF1376 family)
MEGQSMSSDCKIDLWMPLWIADYLADTSHLSTIEHGAYLLLLMHYWRKGPLQNNLARVAQIAKLNPDAWSIAQALLDEFFTLAEDGMYHQSRADREIAKWQGKRLKAKEKAKGAANARWGKYAPSITLSNSPSSAPSNAQAMLGSCPPPSPSIKTKATPKASPVSFVVPDWINKSTWKDFEEMRKKIRAPMTDRARREIVKELERLKSKGNDPEAVLTKSITKSWRDVFELAASSNVSAFNPQQTKPQILSLPEAARAN